MYNDSVPLVSLSAAYGLVESQESDEQYIKWLSCWTLGLLGKCGKATRQLGLYDMTVLYEEVAGICWYSIALDMLLKKNQVSTLNLGRSDQTNHYLHQKIALQEALLNGLEFSDKVEKFIRLYPKEGTVKDLIVESNNILCGHHKVLQSLAGDFYFGNVSHILYNRYT